MTFIEALKSIKDHSATFLRISRPDGPSFRLDDLGGLLLENECLYVGDILDFDDWTVEALEGENHRRMGEAV